MTTQALLPLFVRADVWLQLQVAHPLAVLLALTLFALTAVAIVQLVRRLRLPVLVVRPLHEPASVRPAVCRAARPRAPVLLDSGNGARAPGATERHRFPS